jgi:hypothetical protein
MRFAALPQLALNAVVERIIPGALHPDGRRYLPQLVLRLPDAGDTRLLIVDRHHVSIGEDWHGRPVVVALLCALSRITRQPADWRAGWQAADGRPRADLPIGGLVAAPLLWEAAPAAAGFASIYTEFVLQVSNATIGVKTSLNADGQPALQIGEPVLLSRSRIDLLQIRAAEGLPS